MNPESQIRQRFVALHWWRRVATQYPGGVVPLPTAARILGVSPTRLRELVALHRITLISGMPGGTNRDVFVPVDELMPLGFAGMVGKKGLIGAERKDFSWTPPVTVAPRNSRRIKG